MLPSVRYGTSLAIADELSDSKKMCNMALMQDARSVFSQCLPVHNIRSAATGSLSTLLGSHPHTLGKVKLHTAHGEGQSYTDHDP